MLYRDDVPPGGEANDDDDGEEYSYFTVVLLSELKGTSGLHKYWITVCVVNTSEQEPQDVNVLRV